MTQKNKKQEPDVLHIELLSWDERRIELENDGVMTTRVSSEGGEDINILQTRAAFRGFVGSLTELLNYTLDIAYGTWVDENGIGHYEEEGGAE